MDMNTAALAQLQRLEDILEREQEAAEIALERIELEIYEAVLGGDVDGPIMLHTGHETATSAGEILGNVERSHYQDHCEALACLMAFMRGDKDAKTRTERLMNRLAESLAKTVRSH